jgi:hypothetical protein
VLYQKPCVCTQGGEVGSPSPPAPRAACWRHQAPRTGPQMGRRLERSARGKELGSAALLPPVFGEISASRAQGCVDTPPVRPRGLAHADPMSAAVEGTGKETFWFEVGAVAAPPVTCARARPRAARRKRKRKKGGPSKQGISPQFPGVLVGPPHVRKCHQMPSKEHIQNSQLGWVVRWVPSTPPGHPTAGRCVRVVPVLPLLLCTRPARARPSIGG